MRGRRLRPLVAAAVGSVALLSAVTAAAAGDGRAPEPPSPQVALDKQDLARLASLVADSEARSHPRGDSAAQNEKEQTLTGIDASEALASVRADFPALLTPAGSGAIEDARGAPIEVERYLGENIARLAAPPGKPAPIAVATRPLRTQDESGHLRPVDMDLTDAGGALRPANAPFVLDIGHDPAEGFRIGPSAARSISVTPVGVSQRAPTSEFQSGRFAANTHPDTDSLQSVELDGLETFENIRSSAAPQDFSYRLGLADGQQARLVDGGLEVRQGDEPILRSPPPVAIDSNGVPVPSRYSLADDVLSVHVAHREQDFAYPVALDPAWSSNYDWAEDPGTGPEGFYATDEPAAGGPWYQTFLAGNPAFPGLLSRPIGGRVYPAGGPAAKMFFLSPGSTRIASVDWRHVTHLNNSDRQVMRLAMYGGSNPQVFDRSSTAPGFVDRNVFQSDSTVQSTAAHAWLFTPPCDVGEPNCPRFIPSGNSSFVNIGSVDLVLSDDDFPTVTGAGTLRDMADTWSPASGDRDLTLTAQDTGSGVDSYELLATDQAGDHPVHTQVAACDETHNTQGQGSNICPFSDSVPFSFDVSQLPEGRTTFLARGSDFAGNDSDTGGTSSSWNVYVDRTPPTIEASDDLRALENRWSNPDPDKRVELSARDGRSGVASYELSGYDDEGKRVFFDQTDSCTPRGAIEAPCPTQHSTTLSLDSRQLPEGRIRFVAKARDYAGNDSAELAWNIFVDRTAPAARASGPLEDLQDRWTAASGPVEVDVEARDAHAGIQRIELEARNADGRQVIAAKDVCEPAALAVGEPCPGRVSDSLLVNATELPDGKNSFEVKAIDLAGNRTRDGEAWDTYIDHTPPPPVRGLAVTAKSTNSVKVSWDRVPDNLGGSGIDRYEYMVQIKGQPSTQWQSTKVPYATIGRMPPGTPVQVILRAIDKARNVSGSRGKKGRTKPRAKAAGDDEHPDCRGHSPCGAFTSGNARAAVGYAMAWADAYNDDRYGTHFDNDCTSFISQALRNTGGTHGFAFMGEFKHEHGSWWLHPCSGLSQNCLLHDADWTKSWTVVTGFVEHELEYGRMKNEGTLPPRRWRLADVIVYNWNNGGPDDDHMGMVTAVAGPGAPRVSQHSNFRNNVPWEEMTQRHIPDTLRQLHGTKMTYFILRPVYKYANP